MKAMKALLVSAAVFAGALASFPADAGGVRFGVAIGIPGPWYYPAPYYYYPPYYPPAYAYPPVVVQQQAPAYVEQSAPAAQQKGGPSKGYWYYCADAKAYYPYVKDCPGGWQQVAAEPPQQPAR